MDLLYTSEGVPQWAAADRNSCRQAYAGASEVSCSSGVANLKDWDDFVTALVTRYKGKIRIYQLWNEPDQSFTGSMIEFVQLTKHMHDIVRRLDAQAVIVTPAAVRPDWIAAYWAAGGGTDVDVVGLHGYPPRSSVTAESLGPEKTEPLRALMSKYGLAERPLWDTEGSWGDPSSGVNTPDQQAAFVARFCLLHWSNGYDRFYWYAWDDNELWGTLWDRKKGPLAAAVAYEQVYHWMVGARMSQPCSEQPGAIWTCGFTRPGGYRTLAIWNAGGRKGLTPPRGYLNYRDLAGHTFPIKGAIVVDAKPILLEASLTRGGSAGGFSQYASDQRSNCLGTASAADLACRKR
jgi:hypothetical protein